MRLIKAAWCALAILLAGCAPRPERAGIPTLWTPSPNFDARRPNFVIIHHTGSDDVSKALRALADPLRAASAHYLIGRDGTIYQLVDEDNPNGITPDCLANLDGVHLCVHVAMPG